jgi:hypothetical protein
MNRLFYQGLLLAVAAVACSRGIEVGSDHVVDASTPDGSTPDASALCVVRYCDGKIYACGDCLDNDGDGLVDTQDTECLGACDDLENSYASGMVGPKDGNCKLDCAFDGDNGSGNDDCHWSQHCDPRSVAPDYPPSGDAQCVYDLETSIPGTSLGCTELAAAQSALCLTTCLPLTPVGCDCFGCCNLPAGSAQFVWTESSLNGQFTCDQASLNDPSRCRPCTPVKSCMKN